LGGIAKSWNSNYISGSDDWVVVEADEFDRSFLQLSPDVSVLLSMDPDHLDIYGNAEQVLETGFKEFLKKVKPSGTVLINQALRPQLPNPSFETYGLENGDFRALNTKVGNDGYFEFDFEANQTGMQPVYWKRLRLSMPGSHNVENACAAAAVALKLGVKEAIVREALSSFEGIVRRFEIVLHTEMTVFIDDYAHHPTEIRSLVHAARELYPERRITGIFQPHLYSRTRDFMQEFAEELDKLDEIILMDIYPAREEPIPGISSEVIFEKMKNPNRILTTKSSLLEIVAQKQFDVLLTIGAGDIDTFVSPIKQLLINKTQLF
jgi:UDP-N-acetylmuramate--alanine ligase